MNLPNGTLLQGGKYRIEGVLGQGGFGITYRAVQVMLGRTVAIKEFFFRDYCTRDVNTGMVTIATETGRDTVDRFRRKFIKEAQMISSLRHDGIVQIYDVFEENSTAYYVMEYLEGESLSQMVTRLGSLPEDVAVARITSVGDALSYIHGKHINHLDVKPSNIICCNDGRTVLIDFGVSKQYDITTDKGTTTTPVGISHGYSPAEQYQSGGVQSFSPQSDVYSLAATLYKLLTGTTPPEALVIQEDGVPFDALRQKGISQHIIEAINAAMKPRKQRTQTVAEFISQITATPADDVTVVAIHHPAPNPIQQPLPGLNTPLNQEQNTRSTPNSEAESSSSEVFPVVLLACVVLFFGIFLLFIKCEGNHDETTTYLDSVAAEVTEAVDSVAYEVVSVENKVFRYAPDNTTYTYTGDVDGKGQPDGIGTAIWADGRKYIGTYSNGQMNGQGIFEDPRNQIKFEGEMKNDRFYRGKMSYTDDGSYFDGTFRNGDAYDGTYTDSHGVKTQVIKGNL